MTNDDDNGKRERPGAEPAAADSSSERVEAESADTGGNPDELTGEADESTSANATRATIIGIVALAILLVAGAGAAWYWYENAYRRDLSAIDARIAAFEHVQRDSTAALALMREELGAAADASAAAIAAMEARVASNLKAQDELRRSVSALYEKETQTSVDWILAEAEYLVLAATQRLALERDVDTALAAMRAADQRLRSVDHPDLIPIRDQLIKDITTLEGVNRTDIEGLALYFANAIDTVDGLPTKPIAEESTPFGSVREGEYEAKDWRKLVYAIFSDLVELVEVKDAELPDSVLFDPELRYFLQQNLKLELASARLAVLRRDDENLRASAALVKRQLEAYYDVTNAGVSAIIARLDEAAALELDPRLPNISGSLDVIRKRRAEQAVAGTSP